MGKDHGNAFVVSDPARITVPGVGQVRRKQCVEVIIGKSPLQRLETYSLQYDVAVRIRENFFVNLVAPTAAAVDQLECRNARFKRTFLKLAVALLLGKKSVAVGHHESHVAGACLVDAREIDLVQNSVA